MTCVQRKFFSGMPRTPNGFVAITLGVPPPASQTLEGCLGPARVSQRLALRDDLIIQQGSFRDIISGMDLGRKKGMDERVGLF